MNIELAGGGSVELADSAFAAQFNGPLVHQVITAYQAGGRAGTKAQKIRTQARGGGAKPWRQKGTGRARAGTIRSPLWVGGGRAFPARPRSFAQKVNRKMYRGAVRCVLSELIREERLVILAEFAVSEPKTRELVAKLEGLDLHDVLIVVESIDRNLELASRNLPWVDVRVARTVDPVSLISRDSVAMTVDAARTIEKRLA